MSNTSYLGTALAYPIQLQNGKAVVSEGVAVVRASIIDILETPIGSKFFLGEYGSRTRQLLFEPNDDVLKDLLRLFISEAIATWEQRTKLVSVEFSRQDDYMQCVIEHRILASNEIDSFIYPFYSQLKY